MQHPNNTHNAHFGKMGWVHVRRLQWHGRVHLLGNCTSKKRPTRMRGCIQDLTVQSQEFSWDWPGRHSWRHSTCFFFLRMLLLCKYGSFASQPRAYLRDGSLSWIWGNLRAHFGGTEQLWFQSGIFDQIQLSNFAELWSGLNVIRANVSILAFGTKISYCPCSMSGRMALRWFTPQLSNYEEWYPDRQWCLTLRSVNRPPSWGGSWGFQFQVMSGPWLGWNSTLLPRTPSSGNYARSPNEGEPEGSDRDLH